METPNTDFSELKVKPKYNGNIAKVIWKTATTPNDNVRKYGYVYDGFNRLLAGFYQKDTNPAAKEYFERQEYDLNGNITRLERSTGDFGQGSNAMKIDNLQYQYTGNKLISVKDNQQNSTGYPYFTTPNTIQYDNDTGDGNGNIIKNLDKKITSLKYNYLNLSNTILGNSYNISYTYRADGVKVGKVFSTGTFSTFNIDYIDGFQYSKNDNFPAGDSKDFLQFFPTSEGYFDYQQSKYVYHYTDHLGNIRVSYMANGTAPRIIEENNYYPFGLKHQGYNNLIGNSNYQYKYNGRGLQETGMYDYGARMYMPDIGRWGVMDTMSEKYRRHSPYNYAINNSIKFTDPDDNDPLYGEEAQAAFSRIKDWYQNNKTGNIECKDTDKQIKGYTSLGRSNTIGASADGYDRMYHLHANGFATVKTGDDKTELLHAEGGETLSMVSGGTITTSATSVSGLAAQISYTQQILLDLGITVSIGYVADSYGGIFGGKFYYSTGYSLSNSSGPSIDFTTIKATNNERLFDLKRDFQGFGNSATYGFGGGFSWGGSSATQKYWGVNNMKSQEWGQYDGGYSTFGFSYSLSKPSFGTSFSRTNTKFFKPPK